MVERRVRFEAEKAELEKKEKELTECRAKFAEKAELEEDSERTERVTKGLHMKMASKEQPLVGITLEEKRKFWWDIVFPFRDDESLEKARKTLVTSGVLILDQNKNTFRCRVSFSFFDSFC